MQQRRQGRRGGEPARLGTVNNWGQLSYVTRRIPTGYGSVLAHR